MKSMLTPEEIERINKNREDALIRLKRTRLKMQEEIDKNPPEKIVNSNNLTPRNPQIKISLSLETSCRFKAECQYNTKIISIFKLMATKIYNRESKIWSFDVVEYHNLITLLKKNYEFTVEEIPHNIVAFFNENRNKKPKEILPDFEIEHGIKDSMYPHQFECLRKAIQMEGRILIADEMGLGKTLQALAIASFYRSEWPLLIVCPTSLKSTWFEAVTRWLISVPSDEIVIIKSSEFTLSKSVYITSYESLNCARETVKKLNFKIIIGDESHNIKNMNSTKTKIFLSLAKTTKRLVLLSGTPLLSRPLELYSQINLVCPFLFTNFHKYAFRYCDAKKTQFGYNYNGASNLSELKVILEEKVMIRRLKSDVLIDIPPKTRKIEFLDDTLIERKYIITKTKVENKNDNSQAILQYYNESCLAKTSAVCSYVIELSAKIQKIIVFAHHKHIMDSLSNTLKINKIAHIKIDGSVNCNDRHTLCNKFQNNITCRIALLSLNTCSTGLNLTVSQTIIFAELTWNPGVLIQAEDRVHRIGQQKEVTIIYLIAKGTIDDQIWQLLNKKLEIASNTGFHMSNLNDATNS